MRLLPFAALWFLFGVGMACSEDNVPATITIKPLAPQPRHFTLSDLPKPFATQSASKQADVISDPLEWSLNAPQGFHVSVYAKDLKGPRWLHVTPAGDLLVTETDNHRILRLADKNGDGIADEPAVFANAANGLDKPFGMAFSDNAFFIADSGFVRRYDFKAGQDDIKGRGTKILDLPKGGRHWTRDLALSPDKTMLYVSVGSESNVDDDPAPRASILRIPANSDGTTKPETFASGTRNPVSITFKPGTSTLFAAVQERDELGDDLVPDYFTAVQDGGFYGWPFAYLSKDNLEPRRMNDGHSEKPELAAKTITPDVIFEAHAAVMATAWPQASMFPEKYRSGAFVVMRGSWNRSAAAGYKIVFVPFNGDKPTGAYEDFITGFVLKPEVPQVWARPVGAAFLNDGSFVFTDEANGRIYRVTFKM